MSVGNTKYGDGALQKNINGSNNTAFGICSSRDTDVSWNTSVGAYANMSNVSGISNVAMGTNAHLLGVSGSYNTALGTATLLNNKANSNTAVGSNAMEKNTTGKENVSVGVQSGYENTNGEKNVFLGSYAGFKNFDGSENIFLGNNSGNNPASNFSIGSKNSFLGANTGVANTNDKKYTNSTAIGYGSIIDASNQIMMGTTNENVIIPGNAYLTMTNFANYTEQSIVSKKYVDTYVSGGIQITKPCRCATTEPIDLNNSTTTTNIDGININQYFDLSRVLVRCQDAQYQNDWVNNDSTSSINNGIYVYNFNSSSFTRASDCAGNNVKGQATLIVGGNLNKSNIFVQTNYDSITNEAIAGTDPLEYIQFVKLQFSIGDGLKITGDTLQVKPDITDSAGDPYLTNIGILGKLSVGSDVSMNGKLRVTSDASFNSSVDVSGTLNVINSDAYVRNIRIGYGSGDISTNVIVGNNAGNSNTTGINNLYFGNNAGNSNTTGSSNLYFGNSAGKLNTTGIENVFIGTETSTNNKGSYNVALGFSSGIGPFTTTTASNCVIIGHFSGKNNSGNSNVFIGKDSAFNNTTGEQNTFVGTNAGRQNQTGNFNSYFGKDAGYNNKGSYNVALGNDSCKGPLTTTTASNCVTIGYQAGIDNSGNNNTFIGYQSGVFNKTGNSNSYLGYKSGLNSNGNNNVAMGYESGIGSTNTTASNCVTIGYKAGIDNSGNNNVLIGYQSGFSNTNATNNTFIGYQSGYFNKAFENVFVGSGAGYTNEVGSNNSYFGVNAGNRSTGSENVFIGRDSGYNNRGNRNVALGRDSFRGPDSYTTASYCVTIGYQAGKNNSGNNNNFFGYQSGFSNTTGISNTFIGYNCGYYNTTGISNTFIGYNCGYYNTTGELNTFIGFNTARCITSGNNNIILGYDNFHASTLGTMSDNVAIGNNSGYVNNGNKNTFLGNQTGYNLDGSLNTLVGYQSGRNLTTYTNSLGNTLLGSTSQIGANNIEYSTAIGYGALVNTSNTIVIGRTSETTKMPGKLNVTSDASFNSNMDVSGNLSVKNGSVKYSTTYRESSTTLNNNSTYSNIFNVSSSPSCTLPSIDNTNVGLQFLITNINSNSLLVNTSSIQNIYSSPSTIGTSRTLAQYNSQIFTAIQIGLSNYGWSMV